MTPWQYLVLAGLGAFHGLNPGMGWPVALAAGVRDRSRRALLRTLIPIAGGHALAVFAAAFVISLLRSVVATQLVAIAGGVVLVGFGGWRVVSRRHRHADFHPSDGQLLSWSFLMSSLHGAGLVLLPILVATPSGDGLSGGGMSGGAMSGMDGHVHGGLVGHVEVSLWTGLCATAVHTAAMIAVTGAMALLAFRLASIPWLRLGDWFHLDRVWAFALVGSGAFAVAATLTR